jgi:transcriptional regulator with XRE-family HTH domain
MNAVRSIDPREERRQRSPLAAARIQRQLTVEEVAKRSGLSADQVEWLEEGRVYRFPSTDEALLAVLLYGSAIGIDRREARDLAGLPVPPKPLEVNPVARLVAVAGFAALLSALAVMIFMPNVFDRTEATRTITTSLPQLPPAWKINVDVLNGGGDITYTRQVASRIGALGYTINKVRRADRTDYPETTVFYEAGGRGIALRLAQQLGLTTEPRPLPAGANARRLVVVVGPDRLVD